MDGMDMSRALPGNPTPREVAIADQRIAHVAAVVDGLLADPPERTGDHLADVLGISAGPIIGAAVALRQVGPPEAALIAIAAELLYRLTAAPPLEAAPR
jgi:hypothetical protein